MLYYRKEQQVNGGKKKEREMKQRIQRPKNTNVSYTEGFPAQSQ